MLEQQQRKQAEREREIQEDHETESRLRREREELARREQAEIDREKRERELKMMGPRAAQEMLEQQRKETEARREAEAAARRNKGKPQPQPQSQKEEAETGPGATRADNATTTTDAPQKEKSGGGGGGGGGAGGESASAPQNPPLPLNQRAPINFSATLRQPPLSTPLQAPGMHSLQQYFANIGLGGAGLTPPPPPLPSLPSPDYYVAPYVMQQQQQRIQLEGDAIHEELRHIALLLEAQQLNNAIAHNSPPPPWLTGPQPSSAAGAGTYLTTGLPSPLYNNSNNSNGGGGAGGRYRSSSLQPISSSSSSAAASSPSSYAPNNGLPNRSFMTGGSLPPPPLATALPPSSSSQPSSSMQYQNQQQPLRAASSAMPGGPGVSPWQGLFSAPGAASDHGSNAHNFTGSCRVDGADSEELATEPSRFVMPATAPRPSFIPPPAPPDNNHHYHQGPSAFSAFSLSKDLASPTQASPKERPGTGKPESAASLPTQAERGDKNEGAAAKSSTTKSSTAHPCSPGVPPASAAAALSAESELAPGPALVPISDSPVLGSTPHSTATNVADAEGSKKPVVEAAPPAAEETVTPSSSSLPPPSSRRPRAAAPEPPVMILTPRSRAEDGDTEL